MHIEIKDLQTGQSHRIEDAGAKLGRDKNRADVVIADPGVSGAHARIHFKDDKWWLEDLKSSNGTFIDNDRVLQPVQMEKGMTFRFHQHRFEVIDIEPDGDGGRTSVFSASTAIAREPVNKDKEKEHKEQVTQTGVGKGEVKETPRADEHHVTETAKVDDKNDKNDKTEENKTLEPKELERAMEKPDKTREKSEARHDAPKDEEDAPEEAPKAEERTKQKRAPAKSATSGAPSASTAAAKSAAKAPASEGAFGTQLKAAIAFYLAAIPKLPFAFKAMVQESIDDQRFAAMVPIELIAWAAPPIFVGLLLNAMVSLAVMLIVGQFAVVGFIISLVVAVVGAAIGGAIMGFLMHPVLGWWVRVLKGKSDEKSRSNFFVMTMASMGLVIGLSGFGALFAVLPVPFIGIVPLLLMFIGVSLLLYVWYKWFAAFEVVKWYLTVLLVLGAVNGLFTLYNAYRVVDAGIAGFRASAGSSPHVVQLKLGDSGRDVGKEEPGHDGKAEGKDEGKGKVDLPEPKSEGKGDGKAEGKGDAKAERAEKADGKAEARGKNAGKLPASADDYDAYLKKREAIEQAIEKNPTLLTRVEGVLPLYKQMHFQITKVQDKYKKSKGSEGVVADRLRDAEIFEKTAEQVNELHRKLIENGH